MKDLLIKNLKELKSSFGAVGVKAEFESEGATFEEVKVLNELALAAGMKFVLKIGGCEALRDIRDAQKLGIKTLVAPMIESVYAFSKFKGSAGRFISDAELLINIETISGFKILDEVLKSEFSKDLTGIVFGRTDFAGSLNRTDVNSDEIFNYVQQASLTVKKYGKVFILGGGISVESVDFINKLPYLNGIETRKIVFNAGKLDKSMIQKALDFEINWLKYKRSFSPGVVDEERLRVLLSRI